MEASHRTKGLLRLTMACNERCLFCNVPMEDYPRPTPSEEEVLALLDAFAGAKTLVISGGEPTLLKARLVALIAEASRRGVENIEIQTNAILIDALPADTQIEVTVTEGTDSGTAAGKGYGYVSVLWY